MSQKVTFAQLEYFLAAVRHGSISAAAEAHFIAQSTLSEHLRRLERTLGVDLFVRTNRSLILTESGRTLVPHAQRVVDVVDESVASVDRVRTLSGGTVSFGTFSTAHHFLNADLVAELVHRHPAVAIRLVSMNSVQVADAVRGGELEAGLVALPIDDRGLTVSDVVWQSEAVFLSAELTSSRPVPIRTIAESRLILPEISSGNVDPTRRRLVEMAQSVGLTIRPHVEVDSPHVALDLASRGLGATVTSLGLARALGVTEALPWAPLATPLRTTFAFVTRQGATLSPAGRVVVDIARQLLEALPPATH